MMGQETLMGHSIRFCSRYMELASDDDVRFVIGHELAHVLQWAEGRRTTERDANEKALAWLGLKRRPRTTSALRLFQAQ